MKMKAAPHKNSNRKPIFVGLVIGIIVLIAMYFVMFSFIFILFGYRPSGIKDIISDFGPPSYENYTFNIDTLPSDSGYGVDFLKETATVDMETGKDFIVSYNKENFEKDAIYGYEASYTVGNEIKPGLYTMEAGNDASWSTPFFSGDSNRKYVNILLREGAEFKIYFLSEQPSDFNFHLTAQKDFVMYDGKVSGYFIFGLSQSETNIKLSAKDYTEIESYSFDRGGFYHSVSYSNKKVNIKNKPGSAIYFEANQ